MHPAPILALLLTLPAQADAGKRYGVEADAKAFPQSTPKETLTSVLKAIDGKKYDYLVAHLADPTFVDDRVKRVYAGRFEEQVDDTKSRLDALVVKQLRRFLADGSKWDVGKTAATVTSEDVPDRAVRLVKKGDRWYLSHPSEK